MRRILCAAAVAVALCACGDGSGSSNSDGGTSTSAGGWDGGAGGYGGSTSSVYTGGGYGGGGGYEPVAPCNGHLMISEVQTSGDEGDDDEFVELYNPTNEVLSIDNVVVNATRKILLGPAKIELGPRQIFVIAGAGFHGYHDATFHEGARLDDSDRIVVWQPNAPTIDALCYCTGDACDSRAPDGCEGRMVENHVAVDGRDVSMSRDMSRTCFDAGDNASDFYTSDPSTPGK